MSDIVFIDLMNLPPYDCDTPYTKGIGGTQSALCYYAEALVAAGHRVTVVLCNLEAPKISRGVAFQTKAWLTVKQKVDVAVWCSGASPVARSVFGAALTASLKILWIPHNSNEPAMDDLASVLYVFDVFGFVSEWQRRKYIQMYNIEVGRTMLLLNGVSPGFIGDVDVTQKKPYFIYLSQPDRGLAQMASIWPRVAEKWPTAEFHVYSSRRLYGLEDSDGTKALFEKLGAMPQAFLHDPVGQTELVKVCREAAVFSYPATFYETGCITLTEACAAGCVPIVSDLGALGDYFDEVIHYDDGMADAFVAQVDKVMTEFTETPDQFHAKAQRIATYFQTQRDYARLTNVFLDTCNDMLLAKKKAIQCMKDAQVKFGAKQYGAARLHLENMLPMFERPEYAAQYFSWQGVCHYYEGASHNAVVFFEKCAKLETTLQLCVNMILTHEKLKNEDELIRWCEKALTYKFDMNIVFKILNLVQKKPYFDRCKWGRYLLSLWNDDLHDNAWTSLFLSHGNMVVSDFTTVMRHEEGIRLLTDLLTKGLAFFKLHKMDIAKPGQMRNNLEKLFSNLFLNLNYGETRNAEHWRYVKYFMEEIPPLADLVKPKFARINTHRKLRVGFLTGDLVYHPVSYIMNGIIEHFDKSRFETHIFSTTNVLKDNMLQNKMRADASVFYDLVDKKSEEVCDAIIAADIDVLIEMTGHTSNGADLGNVLRRKPARVIANYFAYPNTYGIPEVDFKIGDKVVFPKGLEKFYAEDFCKIEGGLHTYKPIKPMPVKRIDHTGIVFGCTNNPKKYRPAWIKCVAKILKAVEGSRIKFRYFGLNDPSIREFYWKEFEKHGVNRTRVDLDVGATLDKYFDAYADMDICLDPFPYNGGTINIETLYMGIPYVTLLGNAYVSRVGASLLHQVGHAELIAKTEDEYVSLAVALANDETRLASYKSSLRGAVERSTLCDSAAFTRKFEDGIVWMLQEKKWFGTHGGPLSRRAAAEAAEAVEKTDAIPVTTTAAMTATNPPRLVVSDE